MIRSSEPFFAPFNSPLEIGLRTISILNDAFPKSYSLQRLIILDYLSVHSDDLENGPVGLHPKTPHRSGELLVRREALQKGLLLYMGRGLAERRFMEHGVSYGATERTGAFLDVLQSQYIADLRERTSWLVDTFHDVSDYELDLLVRQNLGAWGAEFEMESVLWVEDA